MLCKEESNLPMGAQLELLLQEVVTALVGELGSWLVGDAVPIHEDLFAVTDRVQARGLAHG